MTVYSCKKCDRCTNRYVSHCPLCGGRMACHDSGDGTEAATAAIVISVVNIIVIVLTFM